VILLKNEIIINDNYAELILYKNKQEVARTMIDIDKITILSQYKWYLGKDDYVYTSIHKKHIGMSRFLLRLTDNTIEADHKDGNTLNNRMYNLRPASSQQNKMNRKKRKNNTSGTTGVYWESKSNKWCACIYYNKKKIRLGYFNDINEAVKIRKEAEIKYFGEYRYKRLEQLQLPFEF
jgi:hypothetical protein